MSNWSDYALLLLNALRTLHIITCIKFRTEMMIIGRNMDMGHLQAHNWQN